MTETPQPGGSEVEAAADDEVTLLRGSELLNAEEASQLLVSSPGRVVVWMGERGSGKTRLTARLYERQRLPDEDATFAGSRTLLAFELLLSERLPASGASPTLTAQAVRQESERNIHHLALSQGGERVNLLLADLPGALFQAIADNQLALSSIPLVRRADKLVLIVDGGRLRDPATRASVLTRVRQLLERLSADELPHPDTELALVVTKWDLIVEDPDTLAYWQAREHQLAADVRELHAGAEHVRVAAGAPASFPQDDGVGALRSWLLAAPGAPPELPIEPDSSSFDAPENPRGLRRRRT
jgi:hypothetical protein